MEKGLEVKGLSIVTFSDRYIGPVHKHSICLTFPWNHPGYRPRNPLTGKIFSHVLKCICKYNHGASIFQITELISEPEVYKIVATMYKYPVS